jgi:hypothetical protein
VAAFEQAGAFGVERDEEQQKDHHRVHREHLVLAHQEGHRAFPDVARDQVHRIRALGQGLHAEVEESGTQQADAARDQRHQGELSDQIVHRGGFLSILEGASRAGGCAGACAT